MVSYVFFFNSWLHLCFLLWPCWSETWSEVRTFLVVQSKCFPEFLLHGFRILFNDEFRGEGNELSELKAAGLCNAANIAINTHRSLTPINVKNTEEIKTRMVKMDDDMDEK